MDTWFYPSGNFIFGWARKSKQDKNFSLVDHKQRAASLPCGLIAVRKKKAPRNDSQQRPRETD
ncbi:MAG: hypothetical protein SOX46_01005 [Clostridiaceae bacterium]|nr:hypothetical protein [Enterocloster clostridioformis]MDY3230153.1 hypothetical protein [Clostridiaceae bacterium]